AESRAACPTPIRCRRGGRAPYGPPAARSRLQNGRGRPSCLLQRIRRSRDLYRLAHGLRELPVEQGRELAQEVAEMPRQRPVRSPPGEPLETLIEGHAGQLLKKRLSVDRPAGLRLILLAVRAPHRVPLVAGPLARGEAHEVEGTGTEGRRFPIDHVHRGAPPAQTQQD